MAEEKHPYQDPDLLAEQYRTQDNLQVRLRTHELYGEPQVDFQAWVLDQVTWQGTELVLDVGCGNGSYAQSARARGEAYIAADLSYGMVAVLPDTVSRRLNLNLQRLPLLDDAVDVVLANHMLYHVPVLPQAIREIRRVLRPEGVLLAATNSRHSMGELRQLRQRLLGQFQMPAERAWQNSAIGFSLEDGAAALTAQFAQVTRHDLPGALVFTKPEPVIAYLMSAWERLAGLLPAGVRAGDVIAFLRDELSAHIAQHGEFRVHKLTGVFICRGIV